MLYSKILANIISLHYVKPVRAEPCIKTNRKPADLAELGPSETLAAGQTVFNIFHLLIKMLAA